MKAPKKEEEIVYVGIEDPVGMRRDILEASKSLVRVLKGQHGLKETRTTKHKLIEELRNKVIEIGELVAEARLMLPKMEMSLPEEKKESAVKAKKPATIKMKAPALPKPRAEAHIDKFERELQDIEDKLKSL